MLELGTSKRIYKKSPLESPMRGGPLHLRRSYLPPFSLSCTFLFLLPSTPSPPCASTAIQSTGVCPLIVASQVPYYSFGSENSNFNPSHLRLSFLFSLCPRVRQYLDVSVHDSVRLSFESVCVSCFYCRRTECPFSRATRELTPSLCFPSHRHYNLQPFLFATHGVTPASHPLNHGMSSALFISRCADGRSDPRGSARFS
jgi:hypothetical protein